MPHPSSLSFGKLKTGKNQQRHRKTRGATTEPSPIKLGYIFKSIRHRRLKGKVAMEQQTTSPQSPHLEAVMSLLPASEQQPYEWNTDSLSLLPGVNNTRIVSESASLPSTAEQSIASSEESSHHIFHMRPSKTTSALLPKTPVDPFADASDTFPALESSPSMFDLRSHSAGDYIMRQLGKTLEKLSLGEDQYARLEEDVLSIRSLNRRCTVPETVPIVMSGSQGSPTSSDMIVSPAPHCPPKFKDSFASGYLVNLKQQLQEKGWTCKFARSTSAKEHVAAAPTILITSVGAKHPRPLRSPIGLFGPASHSIDDPALQPLPPASFPYLDDPFIADPFAYSHPSKFCLPTLPSTCSISEDTGEVAHSAWFLAETPTHARLELFPASGQDFATALTTTITNPFDLPPFSIPFL
ncbi:uncharacterized protein EDB91DRAFT_1131788, partial [Suillus paluster]|uniref:uncharacterized protein n=1 Tax=Suillus paluster TaxID=48578 RepID=UPI001B87B81A